MSWDDDWSYKANKPADRYIDRHALAQKFLTDATAESLNFKGHMSPKDFIALTVLYDKCCAEHTSTGNSNIKELAEQLLKRIVRYMETRK